MTECTPESPESQPGAAWGNAALAEQVAQQGQQGQPGALPYRSQLEEAFGTDLSFVRAILGMQGPCLSLGARAYASDTDVVFREQRPALQTVAHEVAHVLQQQGDGPSLSTAGAELDAEQAAAQVARGQRAEVGGSASSGIYRDPELLSGNPQLGTPSAGTTRAWRPRQQEGDQPGTGIVGSSRAATVRILHDPAHPQQVPTGSPPAPVYQEEAGGTPVSGIRGSTTDPMVTLRSMDSPFVADAPHPDDVQQGSIGDCWLLTALLDAVRDNPDHVRSMFTSWTANSVTVRLYRRDAGTGRHVPVLVTVGRETLVESRPGADPTPVGAGVGRRRQVDSEWYAQNNGGILEVHRRDRYEVASWAPLFEKAYARFVEAHGQYGGAQLPSGVTAHANRNRDGTVRSGYDVIDEGGFSNAANEVIYGDRAAAPTSTVDTNFTAGGDLVRANRATIALLARSNSPGAGQALDLSASLDNDTLRARVSLSLTQVMSESWLAPHTALRAEFAYLQTLLQHRASVSAARLAAYDREIESAAAHATRPGAWPLLDSSRSPRSATALRELLLDLQTSGDDEPRGQRMMYTDHAYQVVRTHFRDAAGADLVVDPSSLDATFPRIDGQRTTVRVRNPHGTNEPDRTGRSPGDGADDGQFDLTLEQFLRHTGSLDISSHRTPAPGTCS
jgi:hypothetical protein